jgi:peptidoglycan/xylan/chitin deacetylase (PgdA/CDA1 family)
MRCYIERGSGAADCPDKAIPLVPMLMLWKKAARLTLHDLGGLAVLRRRHRREFAVLMFHSFSPETCANLEALCAHIARHFQPISLSQAVDAMERRGNLPDNAVAITVDDGYRNFLLYGHPIFARHRLPTTLFAVAGFSEGRLWLWVDQIEFGLTQTSKDFVRVKLGADDPLELALTTPAERASATLRLTEALKNISNDRRLQFLAEFGPLCGVEIPRDPPAGCAAMNWAELRAVAAEGVEIGCHTESHPILSRLSSPADLDREIRGAKQWMEERLGAPVRHFCYPNGRAVDVGEAAVKCVRESGYASAVTCTWGLNTVETEKFQVRRTPLDSTIDLHYGAELLAGLHM